MHSHIHLPDREAAREAADLAARLGSHGADEAAARAEASRSLGNVHHYCRWRQIERMAAFLARPQSEGRLH